VFGIAARARAAGEVVGDLMQAEELEVVDQECAGQHGA
jgi:hypothetical protein